MSFQFIHMDGYARKPDKAGRSIEWILNEADRVPIACIHIETPKPPKLVYGCSISELRQLHDVAVSGTRVAWGKRDRAIPNTQKTLMTFVASHPLRADEAVSDVAKMAEYEAWERDTIRWLKDRYGGEFKTAVRHEDEAHMHIHAYVLPIHLRATDLHPGAFAKRRAFREAIERGDDPKTSSKRGDEAYRAAMRELQSDYQEKVGARHGLARIGAGRRRLTRAQWQQEGSGAGVQEHLRTN
ncbi:hypothetical protein HFO56_03255 [Rhizobium laguerreae]|uniref:plasmid recombination protein n=1 Tax=Rhizobium laguerreae TaxID=1076926 RepID=UPI001C9196A7|nr:plasmid recombination protein [Rhizobium laguerreae]MBY3151405.1 hypothetical protein [Rhizobium laguerreae]